MFEMQGRHTHINYLDAFIEYKRMLTTFSNRPRVISPLDDLNASIFGRRKCTTDSDTEHDTGRQDLTEMGLELLEFNDVAREARERRTPVALITGAYLHSKYMSCY
jgi:hypothetical protein